MKHFIIGTAGHIDHGKTALVKALTNIDCDTHPEEKKRGITINPGFAYIRRDDGEYMAFIDVPGHHRFIGNMVAGAVGIDFIMLTIAADDGVMPQTKEHLKICSLLGIKNGLVVINKCDAVSSEQVEMCREEIIDFVRGTFLENKPIFEVSALSGNGIDTLRNYLLSGNYDLYHRPPHDYFRLSIDRTFNVAGFGAIVTGTVSHGTLNTADTLTLLPQGLEVKVRGIQRHTQSVTHADMGTRIAIDLTGVKKESINIGNALWSVVPPPTRRIDAILSFLEPFEDNRFDALFLTGTTRHVVKVKIIEFFTSGQATAQIEFSINSYFAIGDIFILRNSSADTTIAGGSIIDTLALRHKKTPVSLQLDLRKIGGSTSAYIEYKVRESITLLTVDYFVRVLQLTPDSVIVAINNSAEIELFTGGVVLLKEKCALFEAVLMKEFHRYLKQNPLSVIGVSRRKLLEFIGDIRFYKHAPSNEQAIVLILNHLEAEGKLIRNGNNWQLPGMRLELTDKEQENIRVMNQIIQCFGYNSFTFQDLLDIAKSNELRESEAKNVITYFIDLKKIIRSGDLFFVKERVDYARELMLNYLNQHNGIKIGDFRDLLNTNRKTAVSLMDIFDREKIIVRREDIRYRI